MLFNIITLYIYIYTAHVTILSTITKKLVAVKLLKRFHVTARTQSFVTVTKTVRR
jgi:hypothetical protein